ncbi:hypothetical protein [Desulfobulbus elongatus]|uniref:hypothetical protein n=1 Tax=Desulfobulbus elongatus TaxID=53332 RepID=UPI000486B26A|nr:hypothetical protein [Desulfobulbus elongatus]
MEKEERDRRRRINKRIYAISGLIIGGIILLGVIAEQREKKDRVVETERQKSQLLSKTTQLDSLSPEVKLLVETAWPKVEAACPGLDKYSSIIEFRGIEDNFSFASSKEAERVSVVFKVKESPSLVIGDYVTNGHSCFFEISRDGSRLTVPKRPCASLCEGREVHTSEYTKALLPPAGGIRPEVEPAQLSEKLQKLSQRTTITKEQRGNTRINYFVSLPGADILTLTPDEAEQLLKAVLLSNPDRSCCKSAFVSLCAQETNRLNFASVHQDDNGFYAGALLPQSQCGLKVALAERQKLRQKVRWLRSKTQDLALDFMEGYRTGNDLAPYLSATRSIKAEWDAFLTDTFNGGRGCFPVFLHPESRVEETATNVLNTIENESSGRSFPENIPNIQKELERMEYFSI